MPRHRTVRVTHTLLGEGTFSGCNVCLTLQAVKCLQVKYGRREGRPQCFLYIQVATGQACAARQLAGNPGGWDVYCLHFALYRGSKNGQGHPVVKMNGHTALYATHTFRSARLVEKKDLICSPRFQDLQ
jgi:hypothetical protein